jgi:hypothetical protein
MPSGLWTKPKGVRKVVWNRFKDFCLKHELSTWTEIVDAFGITRWGIQRILRDERIGRDETRKKFESSGLNPEWLFKGGDKVKTSLTSEQHQYLYKLKQYQISPQEFAELVEWNIFLKKNNISIDDAFRIIEVYLSSLKNINIKKED